MDKYFEIGVIASAHGLKGDVAVFPTTDEPSRFELLKEITVIKGTEKKIFSIERVWYNKQFVMLKLRTIDDMNQALLYKGCKIIIPREEALPLRESEYYIRDLYGIKVFEGEKCLGEIVDVYPTGANDVYVVQTESEKKIQIPAIKECILNVDIRGNKMTVKLLEGLLDI